MSKKYYAVCGMIVGSILVLMGILAMSGALGGNMTLASGSSSILYSSGYASFGADFYTYVTNNAEEAASASRTVAVNLVGIAGFLKTALGLLMMAFGLFMNCFFGIRLAETKAEAKRSEPAAPARKPEPAPPAAEKPEEEPKPEVEPEEPEEYEEPEEDTEKPEPEEEPEAEEEPEEEPEEPDEPEEPAEETKKE